MIGTRGFFMRVRRHILRRCLVIHRGSCQLGCRMRLVRYARLVLHSGLTVFAVSRDGWGIQFEGVLLFRQPIL